MLQRWMGPIVVLLILGGVVLILALNLNLKGRNSQHRDRLTSPAAMPSRPRPARGLTPRKASRPPAGFREYPIGEEVERNQMRIAAVWLPPVQMDGMAGPSPSDMIHIEADIHATEGNRNGFPKDAFIFGLVVHYTIVPLDADRKSDPPITGQADPDGGPRRRALRGEHRDAQGRPLQADLRRSSPLRDRRWAATATRPPASTRGGSRSRSRSTGTMRARRSRDAPVGANPPSCTDSGGSTTLHLDQRHESPEVLAEGIGQAAGLGEEVVGAGVDGHGERLLAEVDPEQPEGHDAHPPELDVEHLAEHGVVARRDRLGGEDERRQADDQPLPGREPPVGRHGQPGQEPLDSRRREPSMSTGCRTTITTPSARPRMGSRFIRTIRRIIPEHVQRRLAELFARFQDRAPALAGWARSAR